MRLMAKRAGMKLLGGGIVTWKPPKLPVAESMFEMMKIKSATVIKVRDNPSGN
jgi:hypothetical protein